MAKNKLNSEQRFIRNFLIRFFTALFIVFVISMVALLQTLHIHPKASEIASFTIESCYDGDTCTTTLGEKIRLACIDTPESRGKRADPIPAKISRDYLNDLVAGSKVTIRRISEDKYGRTVAEISKDGINIQKLLVEKGLAKIHEKYRNQCNWSKY